MKSLSFKLWLVEAERIVESDSPGPGWVTWKVNHDDRHGRYKKGDLVWFNNQMPQGQKILPMMNSPTKSVTPAQQIQQPQTAKPVMAEKWILAKSLVARPEYHIPAANLDLAMKQYDANSWMYVILDAEEGRLVSRGTIPTVDIKNVVVSQRNAQNKLIDGNKPSELLQAITPKKEGTNGQTIPENRITPEQKAIEDKFARMLTSPHQSHMMINALAGSGKTTVLKHLAWKFSRGKKWLYLVFNAKNKEEAKEEFPTSVQVETTNGWAGREVLGKNHLHPTDRIQDFSTSEKAKMVADTPAFREMTKSLKIPDQDALYGNDPKRLDGTKKSLWYTIRGLNSEFKMEVVRLLGLAKSFAIDPRNEAALNQNLKAVMEKYDLNTDLTNTKEKIQKNSPWAADYLDDLFGESFLEKNFTEELAQAATWMLRQVMPHASQEKFVADSGRQQGTEQNLGAMRDFDDDLWFSAIHADELNWPKYDVVLADEVQDFNTAQQTILKKLAENGAKIVAVGDPNQCHPAGTMISLTGNKKKPIEELEIGDQVVTYNTKKSYFPGVISQGRKVEEIACRDYSGEIITIETETSSVKCTPNHKCLVKLNAENKYCLYLMIKGRTARVGICRANYPNGFGLTIRAIQEQADKAWLLNVYDTERQARLAEIVASVKFGLPQMIFMNNGQLFPSQDFINEVYESIGDNMEKAIDCILAFGRSLDFPIWSKDQQERFGQMKKNYIGSKKSFITQACNLISGFMQVRTFDGTNRGGEWETLKISKENHQCKVYSLKVEPTEDGKRLYIADKVVVHNSIYRFRGADANAFGQLGNTLKDSSHDKDIEQGLTANFRSRQAIVDMSNEEGRESGHVSNLVKGRPFKETPGKIGRGQATKYEVNYEDAFNTLHQEMKDMGEVKQTAFLARTNEPLVHASLRLMKQGTPFIILGKDIANDLNKHIDKIIGLFFLQNNSSIDELQSSLSSYHEDQSDQHSGKAAMSGKLKELKETTEAMLSAIDQFREDAPEMTVADFRKWLRSKFGGLDIEKSGREGDAAREEYKKQVKEQNPVILSTVHKSKGLQFQRVYILRDDLWPHPRSTRDEDLAQELNNKYIGRTRAEDELHIVTLKGQPGYPENDEE